MLRGIPRLAYRVLPDTRFSRILGAMEVHFTPEQEAQLVQIATNTGTDAERLVKNAVLRLLEEDTGPRAVLPGSVVAEMRALRARVKPDPEGWTTRDYVRYGRRLDAPSRRCFRCPCVGFARRKQCLCRCRFSRG